MGREPNTVGVGPSTSRSQSGASDADHSRNAQLALAWSIARPHGGTAIVLEPTAAVIWTALEQWCAMSDLLEVLEECYPSVPPSERVETLDVLLPLLFDEGLIVRSAA